MLGYAREPCKGSNVTKAIVTHPHNYHTWVVHIIYICYTLNHEFILEWPIIAEHKKERAPFLKWYHQYPSNYFQDDPQPVPKNHFSI